MNDLPPTTSCSAITELQISSAADATTDQSFPQLDPKKWREERHSFVLVFNCSWVLWGYGRRIGNVSVADGWWKFLMSSINKSGFMCFLVDICNFKLRSIFQKFGECLLGTAALCRFEGALNFWIIIYENTMFGKYLIINVI